MIVYEYDRIKIEAANYVTVIRVVVVVPVINERPWIVAVVIIVPAVVIPSVSFPTTVPVFLILVSVILVEPLIVVIVVHVSRTGSGTPVIVSSPEIPVRCVPAVISVIPVKIAVACCRSC